MSCDVDIMSYHIIPCYVIRCYVMQMLIDRIDGCIARLSLMAYTPVFFYFGILLYIYYRSLYGYIDT